MSEKRTTKVVVVFFLPANGSRRPADSQGALISQGTQAAFWSSMQASSASGYYLTSTSAASTPSAGDAAKTWAFTIRCVRKSNTFSCLLLVVAVPTLMVNFSLRVSKATFGHLQNRLTLAATFGPSLLVVAFRVSCLRVTVCLFVA